MSENLQNVNDITRGAMAVLISFVLPKEEEGLTVTQAANALGVSVTQLNFMRHSNGGPDFFREDSKVLYKPSSIRAFIQSNTIKSNMRVA